MNQRTKNECTRWALQLIMAVLSPAYVFSLFYLFPSYFSLKIDSFVRHLLDLFVFVAFIAIYYWVSIYLHLRMDKAIRFERAFYTSLRLWVFACLCGVFDYVSRLDSEDLGRMDSLLYFLFPICSIFFTWWVSELVMRYKQWRTRKPIQSAT